MIPVKMTTFLVIYRIALTRKLVKKENKKSQLREELAFAFVEEPQPALPLPASALSAVRVSTPSVSTALMPSRVLMASAET